MNNSTNEAANAFDSRLSDPIFAIRVPAIATFILFVLAAFMGGDAADRDILTLVRFLSLPILALGIYTAVMAGRHLAYSGYRWLAGQSAAGSIGLAAGFLWTGSAYFAGFIFLMAGTLLCALLVFKQMEKRTNRRLARQKSARENMGS